MKVIMSKRQKITTLIIALVVIAVFLTKGITLAFGILLCTFCICLTLCLSPVSIERSVVNKEISQDYETIDIGPSSAERLEAEVIRLDGVYRLDPVKYKRRVLMLGLLGYAYIVGMAIILISLIVVLIRFPMHTYLVAKPGFLVVIGLFLIGKSLWVKFEAPQGIEVKGNEAPELFELIHRIRVAANSPQIDRVVISSSFNCSVAQIPQLGLFGFHKNYLEIGLPLMSSLTVEHFTAVLSHEMGHLSALHGKFAAWICHIQMSWEQLFTNLGQSKNVLLLLFVRFGNWFFPVFDAYSLVFRRQQEYSADQIAKSLVGAQTTAEALAIVILRGMRNDESLLTIMRETIQASPTVPANVLDLMIGSKKKPLSSSEAFGMLRVSENSASFTDSHPGLVDRIRALGLDVAEQDLIALAQINIDDGSGSHKMADGLLGSSLQPIREELGKCVCSEFQTGWTEMHNRFNEMKSELPGLNEKEVLGRLSEEEEGRRVIIMAELGDSKDAPRLLTEFLDKYPQNAGVNYDLGARLLGSGDESGKKYILKAIEIEPVCAADGYQVLHEYAAKHGDRNEAQHYLLKSRNCMEQLQKAAYRFSELSEWDKFESHNMSEETIDKIRAVVKNESSVRRVWVVNRVIPKILGERQPVVIVQLGGPVWKYRDNHRIMSSLYEQLKMRDIYFIEYSDIKINLGSACRSIPKTLVYDSRQQTKSPIETLVRS